MRIYYVQTFCHILRFRRLFFPGGENDPRALTLVYEIASRGLAEVLLDLVE
jgi:hypothetical protein